MPNLAHLALVTVFATSLPLAGVTARESHSSHSEGASPGAAPARGAEHASDHDKKSGAEDGDRGKASSSRTASAHATAGKGPAQLTAGAITTTSALANQDGFSRASAEAAAIPRGPRTVAETLARTFAIHGVAVAVAEAAAQASTGGSARQPGGPFAGVPKPKELAREAIAFAQADAEAHGPRTLTKTFADSFAKVGPTSVIAVATSVSVALAAEDQPGLAAAKTQAAKDLASVPGLTTVPARPGDDGDGPAEGSSGDRIIPSALY